MRPSLHGVAAPEQQARRTDAPGVDSAACDEAATAAEGIAGRNERMVVPILGDLMGLAGPGAHAMSQTGSAFGQLARPCFGLGASAPGASASLG